MSVAEMKRLYLEENKSTTEIAKLAKINRGTVYRALLADGVSMRSPGKARALAKQKTGYRWQGLRFSVRHALD